MDILTYVPNVNIFRQALKESANSKFVYLDENNKVNLKMSKIPTRKNGKKTASMLRINQEQLDFLESIPSVKILGEYNGEEDYSFLSTANQALLKQVHDPKPSTNVNGDIINPPMLMGVFAG